MSKDELRAGLRIALEGAENIPERFLAEGAILPAPLPSWVELPSESLEAVCSADYQLGRLTEAPSRLPDWSLVVRMTRWLEAKYALALADVHMTLRDVMEADLSMATSADTGGLVRRYLEVAEDAVRRVVAGEAVGEVILGPAAEMLADRQLATGDEFHISDVDGIPWRTGLAWLGGSTGDTASLLAVPPGADLQASTAQWKTWVDGEVRVPWIAKVALGYYQFRTLSPVPDADYLARLYVVLELIRAGRLPDQRLPIAVMLERQKDRYWRHHCDLLRTGDYAAWITFFANGIGDLCKTQISLVEGLVTIQRNHNEKLEGKTNDAFTRLVNSLTSSPIADYAQFARRVGVSVRQCRDLVKRASRAGLIREVARKDRKKIFEVPDVVELLGVNEGQSSAGHQRIFDKPVD